MRQALFRLLVLAACALAGGAHAQPPAPRLVVVGDGVAAPYVSAVSEITSLARSVGVPLLRPTESMLQSSMQMGTIGSQDAFVALGASAAAQVLALKPPVRAVSCLTIERQGLPGVVLTHPASSRIELLRRILPKAVQIGVLYDPSGSRADIAALEAAARAASAGIVARPVTDAGVLEAQLERLANEVDVLLGTYDPGIYAARNAAQLIRFSYQHRIPFIGTSDAWARAGALAGFDWDYKDLAAQCASKAMRLAAGEALDPEPQRPRRMPYSLNAATARQLNVPLPRGVVQGARSVFE